MRNEPLTTVRLNSDKEITDMLVDTTKQAVIASISRYGGDFYSDKEKLSFTTNRIMQDLLEKVGNHTNRQVDYSVSERFVRGNEEITKVTTSLDTRTESQIRESINKAVVQVAKEGNKQAKEIAKQEKVDLNKLAPQERSSYVITGVEGLKISDPKAQQSLEPATKSVFSKFVSAFKGMFRNVISSPGNVAHNQIGKATSLAIKHTEKLVESRQAKGDGMSRGS